MYGRARRVPPNTRSEAAERWSRHVRALRRVEDLKAEERHERLVVVDDVDRSRSSIREMRYSSRTESVTRPMLPLNGIAIARPIWMTSFAGGSSPHGAVMMRTSCPWSVSRLYVSRMWAFAPPGRGYAYGETIPIFMRLAPAGSRRRSLVAGNPLLAHPHFFAPPFFAMPRLARFTGSRTIDRHCCLAAPSRCSPSVQCRPSGRVVRSAIARRRSAAVVPGNTVHAVPTSCA